MAQFIVNRKKIKTAMFLKGTKNVSKLVTQRGIYLYTFYFNIIIQIRF